MKKLLDKIKYYLLILIMFSVSCTSDEDIPDCYIDVIVKNNTDINIIVDVTNDYDTFNDEREVLPNDSTIYNDVLALSFKVWGSYNGNDWVYQQGSNERCYEPFQCEWNHITIFSTYIKKE